MRRRRSDAVDLDRHARRHAGLVAGTLAHHEPALRARGAVAANAIFEIGSITKVFTALLLARMAQDGRVTLTERPFRGQPITLADLASHTAGLRRLPRGMWRRALTERRDPYASFGAADLDAAVRRVRVRARGKLRYSNFGAGLLGHLLAERAGRPYGELLTAEVLAPLGQHETWVEVPGAEVHRFADGHDRRGRRVPHWHLGALAGAGALRATAGDLLRFLAVQLDPPDTPLGAAVRLTHAERARRTRLGIGLGWLRLDDKAAGGVLWHNGGTGGFRSFAGFAPGRGTAAVVLSSSARSVDRIGFELLRSLA